MYNLILAILWKCNLQECVLSFMTEIFEEINQTVASNVMFLLICIEFSDLFSSLSFITAIFCELLSSICQGNF